MAAPALSDSLHLPQRSAAAIGEKALSPPLRQRITQPKDANIRFNLTLNGFIINYLREKHDCASTEELLAVARKNLSSLRRIDGSQYKPTFTRVFFGTLERCPAFRKTELGWTIDEKEAEMYKKDILRHIYRRLSRSSKKPLRDCPAEVSETHEVKNSSSETSGTEDAEEVEDEPSTERFRKLLQIFPGFESLLQELASEQKA